ncbi:MAG: Fe-S cluster assembly protein SufB [Thermoflexales bacterium]|nr:Fe-S cluster assembly protein SufB [Thermoflexales bacterium]MCS7324026.1 Fe-S cluster assembly protein SufB [Thermoflexales bacterium]MCX7940020.1 Fe-S cluster assembly protein SufB [Thermoflexales bacterium]
MAEGKSQVSVNEEYLEKYGFAEPENYVFKSRKGLDEQIIKEISWMKGEPEWMTKFRLAAFEVFRKKPMPNWGGEALKDINFDDIYYYIKPTDRQATSWEELPPEIKETYDRLGIPEAEQKYLAGVGAQYESEVVYHNLAKELEAKGVIFLDTDSALKEYPELFRQYFGTIVPYTDNKFAALNSAVWSGGSFIYVPPGVKVEMPLQAYFRINARNVGQFERTLIIVDEGAQVHYVEGCTAPVYSSDSLHSAVVEIIVKKGARCRYTTIQNWSTNVYNLVTKRAVAYEGATMEWVDGNLGCLAEGSTVITPAGVKPIEALEVGEQVLSFDERAGRLCFRRVVAKRFSGYQRVCTVSVGERRLRVTANHPFYSFVYQPGAPKKLGRYRLAYVRADQLKYAIVPRTSIDYGKPYALAMPSLETFFSSHNQHVSHFTACRHREARLAQLVTTTDEIMWLFGLWLGDGNIEVKQSQTEGVIRWAKVGFSVPAGDRARERLMSAMATVMSAKPSERADGRHVSWSSKELAELFQRNGFRGASATKRVPSWVWSLPESQRLSFIAGYLDADGYVAGGKFHLKSVNRALLEDFASLLVNLGITPRLYEEFSEPRTVTVAGIECTAHGAYRLSFALDPRIVRLVSPALRRKAERQMRKLARGRRVGRSKVALSEDVEVVRVKVSEPSEELVPTWDIEVEGTGNFVSEGFIVHNSKLTMKYPAVYLMEPGAHGEILSIAFAGKGQHQDAGGKIVHAAPNTTSKIISKSISKDGGRTSYRGLLKVYRDAENSRSNVVCDALLLDERSRSDTYPYIEVDTDKVIIGHEASVSKIGEEQLFYAMSRGISEEEASTMVVSGFIEPLVKELPMEYAMEMNRLIALQMEGTVG